MVVRITSTFHQRLGESPHAVDEKLREWAERPVPEADALVLRAPANSTGNALIEGSWPGSVNANSDITVRKRSVAKVCWDTAQDETSLFDGRNWEAAQEARLRGA